MSLVLTAALLGTPTAAEPPPCPEGLIHWSVLCLTEAELTARLRPPPALLPSAPTGVERWRPLVEKYWPPDLVSWALKIIACESGGDPNADNPYSSAAGLFQFLRSTWNRGPAPALGLPSYDSGAVFNAEWNVQAAAWLYANWGGTSQWQCKASR